MTSRKKSYTKEELNDILACCELYYELAQRLPDEEEESVIRKVQSLIDNYCEHKNIVTGAYPRSNPPIKCDSCGVLYYE